MIVYFEKQEEAIEKGILSQEELIFMLKSRFKTTNERKRRKDTLKRYNQYVYGF